MKLLLLAIAISASDLSAGQFLVAAGVDPSSFSSKESQIFVSSYSFYSAMLEYFDISIDTGCHYFSHTSLDKSGFTRTELTAAAIISKEKGVDLCMILKELKKEGSFRNMSKKNGFDPAELFDKASKKREEIEKKAGDEIEFMRKVWLSTQPFNDDYEE